MANSSKNPNADDRGPPDQSFVSHGTKWKKKSMDGAAVAEVQRARAAWRPYGIFAHALPRHHCVPRENKTIFGILATRASLHRGASLEVIAQTQLKLKSLRSNRRAQANRQQFDRRMKLEKKNSKIFRFSSVNFDRFHRKRPLFGSLAWPSPIRQKILLHAPRVTVCSYSFTRDSSNSFPKTPTFQVENYQVAKLFDKKTPVPIPRRTQSRSRRSPQPLHHALPSRRRQGSSRP